MSFSALSFVTLSVESLSHFLRFARMRYLRHIPERSGFLTNVNHFSAVTCCAHGKDWCSPKGTMFLLHPALVSALSTILKDRATDNNDQAQVEKKCTESRRASAIVAAETMQTAPKTTNSFEKLRRRKLDNSHCINTQALDNDA